VTLDDVAEKLAKPRRKKVLGREAVIASCPACGDTARHLAVWESDGGWLQFKCMHNCDEGAILSALGMTQADKLATSRNGHIQGAPKSAETVYKYVDEDGNYVFEKIRFIDKKTGKKTFRNRCRGVTGDWDWNPRATLGSRMDLLYRLPEVIQAVEDGETIYINEGEKAVEAFRAKGLVATCQPFGATQEGDQPKWTAAFSKWLKGARVVVVADNDKVGSHYAQEVARSLAGVAHSVKIVSSITSGEKDDAWDHFAADHTVDEFIRRTDLEPPGLTIICLADVPPLDVEWLWHPYIPLRKLTLMDGDGDLGKSYMTLAIAAGLSLGYLPMKQGHVKPCNILLLASEDDAADTLVPRFTALGGDLSRIYHSASLFAMSEGGLSSLDKAISDVDAKVVVIDPILSYLGQSVNISQANQVRPVLDALRLLSIKHNCAILSIRHTGKQLEGKTEKHMGLGSVDIANIHRSQLLVRLAPNDPDLRVVQHVKHNLSEKGKTFGYTFERGQFVWVSEVRINEDDFVSKGKSPRRADAVSFLRAQFGEAKMMRMDPIIASAELIGITEYALTRAKKELGITYHRISGEGWWRLGGDEAADAGIDPEYDPALDF